MTVIDCAACADERAAGAAFCEACGRALAESESPVEDSAASGDAADIGDSATTAEQHPGGSLEADDGPVPSSGLRRPCPHCGAGRAVGSDGYCEECGMLAGRPRDHIEADGGAVAAAVSDRGRRHHRNEDAMWLAVGDDAADVVVCDGVSASFDPDAASDIAARTAGELLSAAQHPGADADATVDLASTVDLLPAGGGDGSGRGISNAEADETAVIDPSGVGAPSPVPDEKEAGGAPPSVATEKPAPALSVAGVVAAAIAGAAEAVATLAHTGDPRRAASNPACTIVAAAVRGPHVGFGWVGDSRVYWLNAEGPAEQLTQDDSWAAHMVALGADPIEAMDDPRAHAITAWLGADAGPIMPRVGAFTAAEDGLLVLCSDGLWNYLPDPARFAETVRDCVSGTSGLLEAARALVKFANSAGGADNITVALVPVHAAAADE